MKHEPIAPAVETRMTSIDVFVIFANIVFGAYLVDHLSSFEISSLYLLRYDRILHFTIGFFVGLSTRRGLVFAASLGLGKECWDHFFGTGFDTLEVFITGLGGIFGYLSKPAFSSTLRRMGVSI